MKKQKAAKQYPGGAFSYWNGRVVNGYLKRGKIVFTLFVYAFLTITSFVFLYPFIYMMITSVKSPDDLFNLTVNWVPRSMHWDNFARAWKLMSVPTHFGISLLITVIGIATQCICCSFIGYGFARYQFPGKKLLFIFVILSIIIPVQTIILPQYMMFANFGWTGTYLPMIVPQFFGYGLRGGLFVFLFRQFFLNMPKSLEEAARLDGCGALRTFFRVSLPTLQSSIVVCSVLSLVWHWNEYYEPTMYLPNPAMWPLPSMLPRVYRFYEQQFNNVTNVHNELTPELFQQQMVTEGTVMAATFIVIVPVLIAYMFLQRKFMQGVERSGLAAE